MSWTGPCWPPPPPASASHSPTSRLKGPPLRGQLLLLWPMGWALVQPVMLITERRQLTLAGRVQLLQGRLRAQGGQVRLPILRVEGRPRALAGRVQMPVLRQEGWPSALAGRVPSVVLRAKRRALGLAGRAYLAMRILEGRPLAQSGRVELLVLKLKGRLCDGKAMRSLQWSAAQTTGSSPPAILTQGRNPCWNFYTIHGG